MTRQDCLPRNSIRDVARYHTAGVMLAAMVSSPGESPGDWWMNTGHAEARRAHGRPTDAPFDDHFLPRCPAQGGFRGVQEGRTRAVRHTGSEAMAAARVAHCAHPFSPVSPRSLLPGRVHANPRQAAHRTHRTRKPRPSGGLGYVFALVVSQSRRSRAKSATHSRSATHRSRCSARVKADRTSLRASATASSCPSGSRFQSVSRATSSSPEHGIEAPSIHAITLDGMSLTRRMTVLVSRCMTSL